MCPYVPVEPLLQEGHGLLGHLTQYVPAGLPLKAHTVLGAVLSPVPAGP